MFAQPVRLDEALDLAARYRPRVLAGGTDLIVGAAAELGPGPVMDISRIVELKGILVSGEAVTIGAGTTWSELRAADLPSGFDGLKAAALEVGSVQIQNRATIGGNICNASPAADGVPPLLTLDAEVEIRAADSVRRVPLAAFITGYRRTSLAPGELVTALRVPRRLAEGRSSFVKLGGRRYLVISIVSVAVLLATDDRHRIAAARVAVGACSPVSVRLAELEAALLGRDATAGLEAVAETRHLALLTPISDVRAGADYRSDTALQLVKRALCACLEGRPGGMA